ncbi:MAG: M28 family metallopeptidase [Solirubrobacterales bacterium]
MASSATAYLDQEWLRELVTDLAGIERESGSPGELEAAEWVAARLGEHGAVAAIETERQHSTYWWPLGLAGLAGALAGGTSLRGHRAAGFVLGSAAAYAAATDMPPGRRLLRQILPKGNASNVVAFAGAPDAERTVVLVAHHDAAHSGLVFDPRIPELADRAGLIEDASTSPPLMWPIIGGPAGVALGSLIGSRLLTRAGAVVSAGFAAAMVDIGLRAVVPGANDNATGVAVLVALARALAERPTERTRVMLVSTSEEDLCQGMEAFGRRHFPELPVESTFIMSVDTVGSPHLCVLRGEGMRGMREYPQRSLALVDRLADELGIHLYPGLRLRNATDGCIPLAHGYECASLASVTALKQPANYHWPTDVPENVDYATVADAARLAEALVRRLDDHWLD